MEKPARNSFFSHVFQIKCCSDSALGKECLQAVQWDSRLLEISVTSELSLPEEESENCYDYNECMAGANGESEKALRKSDLLMAAREWRRYTGMNPRARVGRSSKSSIFWIET